MVTHAPTLRIRKRCLLARGGARTLRGTRTRGSVLSGGQMGKGKLLPNRDCTFSRHSKVHDCVALIIILAAARLLLNRTKCNELIRYTYKNYVCS